MLDTLEETRNPTRYAVISDRPTTMTALVEPSRERLSEYVAALEQGWSPNTTRDVTGEQLAAIEADPDAFLRELDRRGGGGTVDLGGGHLVSRLPGRVVWISQDGFCGAINLRHVPGTEALPPHVSGHVGYAVVPWRQGCGHATRALALMLPIAHAAGLPRVLVTCDADNPTSRRVIERNGGVLGETVPHRERLGVTTLSFWIVT